MRNLFKLVLLSTVVFTMFVLTGCHEGYVSKDGASLKQYLEPEALKKLAENPKDDIWIIDVRSKSAYDKKHIPTAKSFHSSTILDRLSELPKDKYLIVYCETGGRAQHVIKNLEEKGYTKMMNWGGYTRWKWEYAKTPEKKKD